MTSEVVLGIVVYQLKKFQHFLRMKHLQKPALILLYKKIYYELKRRTHRKL